MFTRLTSALRSFLPRLVSLRSYVRRREEPLFTVVQLETAKSSRKRTTQTKRQTKGKRKAKELVKKGRELMKGDQEKNEM